MQIALFGLGLMGSGMASRLLAAGFPLSIYNRSPDKAAKLVSDGATLAPTPREAAAGAEVIVSMVADDAASRSLWLGDDGALAGVSAGAVLIECSTVSVGWVAELACAAQEKGCSLLDAPVTGSKSHAAGGELSFLVGGSAEALEKAQPVFAAMGKATLHLGPTGSGALLKLINNFLCGVQVASLAEALSLIERSSLDRDKALEVLRQGAPGSPLLKALSARMVSRDYTPNFHLHLMAKDLSYAVAEAANYALPLKTAAGPLQLFQQAIAQEHGEQDFSAVIEPLRTK